MTNESEPDSGFIDLNESEPNSGFFDLEDERNLDGPTPLSEFDDSSLLEFPRRKLSPTSFLFGFSQPIGWDGFFWVWLTLPLAPMSFVFSFLVVPIVFFASNPKKSLKNAVQQTYELLCLWSDWLLVWALISIIEVLVVLHWYPSLFNF
jgi:hypothetical protein